MDSQQVRNLQEAYIGVYEGDLTEEQEFKSWVTGLLDEGYDLSDYTWDEMYEIYNEEKKPLPIGKMKKKEMELMSKADKALGPALRTPRNSPERNAALRTSERASNIYDVRRSVSTRGGKMKFPMPEVGRYKPKPEAPRRKTQNEEYDLYDTILSHLMNEGYAETPEAAEVIMVNMSEEWRESIVEEKKPLPIGKMKKKEMELMSKADKALGPALRTPRNSPERNAALRTSERASNIYDVRRSVSTRGGKMKFPMPEVGRFKPKDED